MIHNMNYLMHMLLTNAFSLPYFSSQTKDNQRSENSQHCKALPDWKTPGDAFLSIK